MSKKTIVRYIYFVIVTRLILNNLTVHFSSTIMKFTLQIMHRIPCDVDRLDEAKTSPNGSMMLVLEETPV